MAAIGDLQQSAKGWRAILRLHPAAELFPPMSPDDLRELGEDVGRNGLRLQLKGKGPARHQRTGPVNH
jgi:hypothetical protein